MAFEPDLVGWVGFQLEGMDGKGMTDDGNSMAKVLKGESARRGAGKQTAECDLSLRKPAG